MGMHDLEHPGHRRRQPEGRRRRRQDRRVGFAVQVHGLLGRLQVRRGAGWPSQWWSIGHGKRTAPNDALDVRKVSLRYSQTRHPRSVSGDVPEHRLRQGGGDGRRRRSSRIAVRSLPQRVRRDQREREACERHRGRNPRRRDHRQVQQERRQHGYYFYFDYLWPLVPQDVPDAPQVYSDVSLAIDFDTDHGYKKPPAWHLWQLQKLGFKGHADVYMGVFWNNKRRRVGATFPYATVAFSGTPSPGDVVSVSHRRDHHRPRHRLWRIASANRLPDARVDQRHVLRRVGRRQLRDRAPRSASNRRRRRGSSPASR